MCGVAFDATVDGYRVILKYKTCYFSFLTASEYFKRANEHFQQVCLCVCVCVKMSSHSHLFIIYRYNANEECLRLPVWPVRLDSQQLFYTISDKLTAKNGMKPYEMMMIRKKIYYERIGVNRLI